MKNTIRLFLFIFSFSAFAQFSKTHYIPPLSNADVQAPQGQFLYVSSPSVTPVKFKINEIGGQTINGVVSRDQPYRWDIGSGFDTQLLVSRADVSNVMKNKGYTVEAEDLVYVTVRLTSTPQNNQAGGLVSKGLAALGTQFRIGAFINTKIAITSETHYTFASILATENNTLISFNDIKPGVSLINNAGAGNTPSSIILNSGESYVFAVEGPNFANRDGLIGASITSNKPVAVNCGSFAGTNGTISNNLDLGFDQIVSAERTGTDYIFIKGNGVKEIERPLIVANENGTDVFINGGTTPFATLNAGGYLVLDGDDFSSNNNLYVRTSKNVFAYQGIGGIGGTTSQANQNMHFVPPLSCETPKIISNIPFINEVGNNNNFDGTVCIVTETGAALDFIINGISYTLASLPGSITVNGPLSVTGNSNYVTYTFEGLTGNISVFSTKQVYLSYFGSSGAATYGGFYSGFTFRPEVSFKPLNVVQSNCIPNVELKVNTLTSFDTFQWYFNNLPIAGANSANYFPTQPGYYYVSATISACGTTLNSVEIPVSECPTNGDNDLANDNIDVDSDNDGLANCSESFGDVRINTTNPSNGTISINSYTNTFTGVVSTTGAASPTPFTGGNDGSFVTEVPIGKGNTVTYQLNFAQPMSVAMTYVATANSNDLINSEADFIVKSPINKTITVLNPTNQLLIDTNYDGIYESGITEYSSFEIRFRVNSNAALPAGTGTFSFQGHLIDTFSFTQKNLSDSKINRATFNLWATCVPKDNDLDGIIDQLDSDSDNDGISDNQELTSTNYIAISGTDANANGMDDAYEPETIPSDFDADAIPDYYDLDSDNDGIYDSVETNTNTDGTGLPNYVDLDSDDDGCSDVIEAGFSDKNNDSFLGDTSVTVDGNGLVTNGIGYTTPNPNYLIGAPIAIAKQPSDQTVCLLETTSFTVTSSIVDGYQWEQSTDGINWNILNDNVNYSGSKTNTLEIRTIPFSFNGYKYRVRLTKNGNTCGLVSDAAILTINTLPIVSNQTIIQCDDNLDAITVFNLMIKNNEISINSANEKFSYYTTFSGANTANTADLISDPTAFQNTTPGLMDVWTRVENANLCYSVAKITLQVLATNIPSNYKIQIPPVCDDLLDLNGNNTTSNDNRDGITSFDLSPTRATIQALLPTTGNYTITYYRNQADALAELNAITNLSNYRNIGYPNNQDIWVRVDSDADNACYGLGPFVNIKVEALPIANPVIIAKQCDDNQDGIFTFNTSILESTLLQGQTNVAVTYFDSLNNPLRDANSNLITSPFPASFTTKEQKIKAVVTNLTTLGCFDETQIEFVINKSPIDFSIPNTLLEVCDDELIPQLQDGKYNFTNAQAIHNFITAGQPAGMAVEYYDGKGVQLSSPLPNPLPVTLSKVIRVVVKNIQSPNCFIAKNFTFRVHPLPRINTQDTELVCSNLPNFFVRLTAGISDGTPTTNYTYTWSKDNNLIPNATAATLNVNAEGIYTVNVTNALGCTSEREIKVVASDIARFDVTTVVDLVKQNSITVKVTGKGDYVYSLDYPNAFQTSNVFNNVKPGIREIFVKDLNGCGTVSQTLSVIGAPAFFTPNGDGINDTWNIEGTSAQFNFKSTIIIFDRYGKLIKKMNTTDSWDGTFNGQQEPSSDYWYVLYLEDGREAKGHFTLKR
jgi:gliding motility-associated-like protein